jgi:hypothetical protein
MYIDDADDEKAGTLQTDAVIDYTRANHTIGAETGGASKLNASIAEVYINYAEYIDITIEANRRKFIGANGKPVSLGDDGSIPTGTSPIVYFSVKQGDAATVFATNKGTGGNYTITGALTIATTDPSN